MNSRNFIYKLVKNKFNCLIIGALKFILTRVLLPNLGSNKSVFALSMALYAVVTKYIMGINQSQITILLAT